MRKAGSSDPPVPPPPSMNSQGIKRFRSYGETKFTTDHVHVLHAGMHGEKSAGNAPASSPAHIHFWIYIFCDTIGSDKTKTSHFDREELCASKFSP